MNHNDTIIALLYKRTGIIVWTFENYFKDTLSSVIVWDNEMCLGIYDRFYKNDFITLAEYREQQIKTIIDD